MNRINMTSLWNLTAPATMRAGRPLLPSAVDTVVVGAGLTGLTTGVLLARAGQSVAIVEARHVGAVATGNTTAKLSLLQADVLSSIREHASDEALAAYVSANKEGQAWLERELGDDPDLMHRAPAYTYAVTADGADAIDEELAAAEAAGLPVEHLRITELPYPVTAAIRLDHQLMLHPTRVLTALAEEFESRGGLLIERCRVTDYDESDDGVEVSTERGIIRCESLVLATGTPILDRVAFSTRIVPSRSYAAAYELVSGEVPTGMYVSIDSPTRSLRPATGANGAPVLIVGGESHVTGRSDAVAVSTASLPIEELDRWTSMHFGEVRRVAAWGAQDYRLSGGLPFAGKIPGHDSVYAATGYNKWGMTNSVAAAHAITSELFGRPRDWAETLKEHAGEATETVETVSNVARHLLSDWLEAETTPSRAADDLEEGEGIVVREGITPVAVSRIDGKFCRVSGVCTHLGGVLSWNAQDQSWDCPLHGSRFGPLGDVLEGPAVQPLEPQEEPQQ